MGLTKIKKLIQQGESDTLEFKKSTAQLKETAKTLCAFLNYQGGQVIVGVDDKGRLIGQQVSDQTRQEIANTLQRLEPHAHIEVQYIPLEKTDKKLILFQALSNNQAIPYVYEGRAYRRVQSTTTLMRQEQYQQLLLDRMQRNQRWEMLPATGISVHQLDHEEILRTIKKGIACGRVLPSHDTQDPIEALTGMSLMEEDTLCNAAVVLFSKKFKPHYPQCKIRLARFRGREKDEFIDSKQIDGHAFNLLEEASTFISRHSPISSYFEANQLERTDEPFLPPEAIRETLVNAIVHRDYSQRGGAVSVAIYDDHLEVWSDGTLPNSMTIEKLWKAHTSKPRNELVASVFYLRELFEEWGRGTLKIIQQCRRGGYPDPEFFEEAGSFCVRLWAKRSLGQQIGELTERQLEIIRILSHGKALPLREILLQMKTPPTLRTLRQDLLLLKHAHKVETRGHGRGAIWFLNRTPTTKTE